MTLEEAIAALRDGKKIRLSYWTSDHHIYLKSNILCDSNLEDIQQWIVLPKDLDGWEIVSEKITYYVNIYRKNDNIWTHLYFDKKYADEEKDFLIKQLSFDLEE